MWIFSQSRRLLWLNQVGTKENKQTKKTQILNRNMRGWSSDQTGERVKQQKPKVGVRVTRIHSMRL